MGAIYTLPPPQPSPELQRSDVNRRTAKRVTTIYRMEQPKMSDGTQRYWFQYFPDNFMWSQGMMIAIEMARWGSAVTR